MQSKGYTRVSLAIALIAASGLGYIAYLQYKLAEVDSIIAETIVGAHNAAKTCKLKREGNKIVELCETPDLEKKGWKLSADKQSYELAEDGKVHAVMILDHKLGKVVYKIDCGSFEGESAQQECSDTLNGAGKNYVNTDDVPW